MMEAQKLSIAAGAATLATADELLISDFEKGDLSVSFGQEWIATDDTPAGGNSTASLEVVEDGEQGNLALQVSGEVGTAFAQPWSGALFMPGALPFEPADLSNLPTLHFSASGETADYRVQLFCRNSPQVPGEWQFSVTPQWQDYRVDLASIAGCDTGGVMAIIFSSGQPGPYRFLLDDVRLE
jgi:hypothetical protein